MSRGVQGRYLGRHEQRRIAALQKWQNDAIQHGARLAEFLCATTRYRQWPHLGRNVARTFSSIAQPVERLGRWKTSKGRYNYLRPKRRLARRVVCERLRSEMLSRRRWRTLVRDCQW